MAAAETTGGKFPLPEQHTASPAVLITSFQPCAMLPVSTEASSRANNDQVPLGLVPANTPRLAVYGPLGAGEANPSLAVSKSVGLYVPDAIAPESGRLEAALSSNVKVSPLTL